MLRAVSYTHLDVYKRQPLGGEMDRVIGDIIILVVIGLWIASRLFV